MLHTTLLLAAIIGLPAGSAPPQDDETALVELLREQEAAWNRGDLEAFMSGYWRSPELTFFSGGRVIRGWEATLDRYRRRYGADTDGMGQLHFSDLEVDLLGETGAAIRGRYNLLRGGTTATGLFTLLLRRIDGRWQIIHDHTSSEPG